MASASDAIQSRRSKTAGLLRFARNDGERARPAHSPSSPAKAGDTVRSDGRDSRTQSIENNPMQSSLAVAGPRVPAMTFDTSGKSPAHFHHREIAKPRTNLAPASGRQIRRPQHRRCLVRWCVSALGAPLPGSSTPACAPQPGDAISDMNSSHDQHWPDL